MMTYEQKQCLMRFFGCYSGSIDGIWGPQSSNGTILLQRKCGLREDGVFGTETETVVRQLIGSGAVELPQPQEETNPDPQRESWWDKIQYFSPDEFMCQCHKYTKYCDGWPARMQELTVRICDRTRQHFGVPVTIISGLRCAQHNAAPYVGGVANSQHMYGEAVDLYAWGKDANAVLAYLLDQPEVTYAYVIPGTSNVHFNIAKRKR